MKLRHPLIILALGYLVTVTILTLSAQSQVITSPVELPDVSLQGGVNHFRSRQGRDAQTISDMLRRIQDGFDGVKLSVEEIQGALAPGVGGGVVDSIGDVRITSVLKTYTTIDDNNSVVVMIQVNFNSPTPTGDWDRVHVYLEKPDVSDPTPLDPTGGPVFAMGIYTGLVAGANIIYVFELPPSRQEGWRIYLVSGTPAAVKPLALTTAISPSPNSLLTVDPVPEGSSGAEWTSVTTNLSASVEYAIDMVGAVIFRIYGTFTPPSDPTYRGTLIVAKATTESDWRTLSTEPTFATTFTSTWMPVPVSSETWDVCTQAKGSSTRFNSIVSGTTDCDQVVVEDQAGLGGLDLTRLDITTFNTDEFEVSGGAFQMNEISATKIVTGTLKVGGGATDKPGQMGVFDAADQLIGWVGEQGIYYGAWFKQLWVGGTDPTTAPLYTDSSGDLFMTDGAITINKTGGDTINIDTTNGFKYTDSATNDYTQFTDNYLTMVHTAGTEHMEIYPDGMFFTQPGTFLTSLDASSGHGELTLADGLGMGQPGIFMDGLEKHISIRDSGTSTTPDLLTGGTLASASKDAYWYDVDSVAWRRLAYFDELGGGGLPVDDDTAIVYKTGASSIELFFDITNFSADRTISFPNVSGIATLNANAEVIAGAWEFSADIVTRDIEPNATASSDLGTTSKRWNNVRLANGLYMAGSQMIDGSRNIANAATIATSVGGTITGHQVTVNSGPLYLSNTTAVYRGIAGTDAIINSSNLGRFSSLAIGATYAGRTEIVDATRDATFNSLAIDAVASIAADGGAAFVDLGWSGNLTGAVGTGNFYIRAISGAPDCTAGGGVDDGWIAIDTTNHRLYVCDGTSNYFIALGT